MASTDDEGSFNEHICLNFQVDGDSDSGVNTENEKNWALAVPGPGSEGLGQRSASATGLAPIRWFIVFVYGVGSMSVIVNWNLWSPMANAALAVFPDWNIKTLLLMNNWGAVAIMTLILPVSMHLRKYGIKRNLIVAASLSTFGTGLRLLQIDSIYVYIVQAAAILNSIGGVFQSPCSIPLSVMWFPHNERTLALGISTSMFHFGIAVSHLLSDFIVNVVPITPSNDIQKLIRFRIMIVCIIGFVAELLVLIMVVFLVPEEPEVPVSKSYHIRRHISVTGVPFCQEVKEILHNGDFLLLTLSSAVSTGISTPWLILMPIIIKDKGLNERETIRLSIVTVICSCIMTPLLGILADRFPKQKIFILIFLNLISCSTFLMILLMTNGAILFRKGLLYFMVILGFGLLWSLTPLYYDLSAEVTFPKSEGTVNGLMKALSTFISVIIYLTMHFIPAEDFSWMTYALVVFGFLSLALSVFVTVEYERLHIDRRKTVYHQQ